MDDAAFVGEVERASNLPRDAQGVEVGQAQTPVRAAALEPFASVSPPTSSIRET